MLVHFRKFFENLAIAMFPHKHHAYERLVRLYLFCLFALLCALSLLCITGAIGLIIYEVQKAENKSTLNESLYWMFIIFIVVGSGVKALFFFLSLSFYALLPYSSLAQSVYLQDKEKLSTWGDFSNKSTYYITGIFPFWEVITILRDPLPFLKRLIRGEAVRLPNYPVWYDPNDTLQEKNIKLIKKYKLAKEAKRANRVDRKK